MNSFKRYVNKDRKGAMTFEWGITCPVMLMVLFIVIFMFLFVISYVNYSSFASNIASSMNFRSTGVENASEAVKGLGQGGKGLNVAETVLNADGTVQTSKWLNANLIRVNGSNAETDFKRAVYYYINQHAGQVFFPFCYLDDKQVTQQANGSSKITNRSVSGQDTSKTVNADSHTGQPFFVDVETLRMTSNTTATRVPLDRSKKTAAEYANVLVKCDVKYNFFPIYMIGYTWPGMTIYTSGYSILT